MEEHIVPTRRINIYFPLSHSGRRTQTSSCVEKRLIITVVLVFARRLYYYIFAKNSVGKHLLAERILDRCRWKKKLVMQLTRPLSM